MNWDTYYAKILYDIASKSKDPHSKYGAIIVNRNMHIKATGYNGLPRGVEINQLNTERPAKYNWWVHAETNALYNAAREGIATENCSMYAITVPCLQCMCAIRQSGIKEVIYFNDPPPMDGESWRDTIGQSAELARKVDILLRKGGDR